MPTRTGPARSPPHQPGRRRGRWNNHRQAASTLKSNVRGSAFTIRTSLRSEDGLTPTRRRAFRLVARPGAISPRDEQPGVDPRLTRSQRLYLAPSDPLPLVDQGGRSEEHGPRLFEAPRSRRRERWSRESWPGCARIASGTVSSDRSPSPIWLTQSAGITIGPFAPAVESAVGT